MAWVADILKAYAMIFLLTPVAVHAASANRDLEGIKKKIENEKRGLSQLQKKEGSVLQSLGAIDADLERKTRELKQASVKLTAVSSELQQKERQAAQLQVSIGQRQALFAGRAVALYRRLRGGKPLLIDILLNRSSPAAMLQQVRYLQSTLAFDGALVQTLSDQKNQQERVQKELTEKRDEVSTQKRALASAAEAVRKEAGKRRELLASLRTEKESRARALKELEQAALRLQKMIDEIARRSALKPRDLPSGKGLDAMRGKLDWPVKGHVIAGFGKTKHREFATEVFRNGLDIDAPMGAEIKAVEKGKVVFADRFSGYGKMLIIDHGERYYTVYAHLSEILKKTGDAVERGETVASVGDSDSLAGAKLYFEMRKDGKSIDPTPWFRR
jgi:murein hydrolase activator